MFWNNLIITYRNLKNSKWYTFINISGLAIGLASSILLLLYIFNQWNYNQSFQNIDRTYAVIKHYMPPGQEPSTSWSQPNVLGPTLAQEYPEIASFTRHTFNWTTLFTYKETGIKGAGPFVDSAFLEMFDVKLIKKATSDIFEDPNSIIISSEFAKRIFKDEDPLNKIIKRQDQDALKVVGVYEPFTKNSFLAGTDFLLPWKYFEQTTPYIKEANWGNFNYDTYLVLKPNVDYKEFNKKIKYFIDKHSDDAGEETITALFPLSKKYLYGKFVNGKSVGGRIDLIRLLLILTMGILVIACINFMNLSTARSEKRAKEVGIRKSIGASRVSLTRQFLVESILLSFFSCLLAILIVLLVLPYFNRLLSLQLILPFTRPGFWLGLVGLILFTGFLAGSYPAIYLSSFKPIEVLKNRIKKGKNRFSLRQVLVITQFTFAVGLIVCSIIIFNQVNYIKNLPMGYDNKQIIQVDIEGATENDGQAELVKQRILDEGAATSVCITSNNVSRESSSTWGVEWSGMKEDQKLTVFQQVACSDDFVKTFGMQLTAGRDFEKSHKSDSTAVILNEAAVKTMGFQDPIGQTIKWQGENRTVIGVIKNFTLGSPYEQQNPLIVGYRPDWRSLFNIKLPSNLSTSQALSKIEKIFKEVNPAYPFEYRFIDKQFEMKFINETLLGDLVKIFGSLAIIISCLGLFGLAAFSAEQRTKEIGVRKVLGASVNSIVVLLSGNFIKLVIVSNVIGWGLSYWAMHNWLQQFTFKTGIHLWEFAVTGVLSILIAILTVSTQAIRAAWMNPVKSLKSE